MKLEKNSVGDVLVVKDKGRLSFNHAKGHNYIGSLKRGRGQSRVSDPVNFWAVSANRWKMVKATDFKFSGMHGRSLGTCAPII